MTQTRLLHSLMSGVLVCSLGTLSTSGAQKEEKVSYELREPLGLQIPWGLDVLSLRIPADNPITKEKVELGKLLFFDRTLSRDGTVSCADCHNPNLAFTDGKPVSTGFKGQKGGRSSPTLVNRAFSTSQFWDGRAPSLEEQAKGPMVDPVEMGNGSHDAIVIRLQKMDGYRRLFHEAFGTENFTIDHVAKAIATFERTLLSGDSSFDRFQRGDQGAISSAAERGFLLFQGKARCFTCHTGFNFSDEEFHALGSEYQKSESDFGLYKVTRLERDKGKFKTPTLREIANTTPYMHDGRFRTLEQVVDFYNRGGIEQVNGCSPGIGSIPGITSRIPLSLPLPRVLQQRIRRDRPADILNELKPLNLKNGEKRDLVEFLKSLSGQGWQHVQPPAKFPE